MTLTQNLSDPVDSDSARRRCSTVRETLIRAGLYAAGPSDGVIATRSSDHATNRWRIAPDPFVLSPGEVTYFRTLGQDLLAFYRALNRLYVESIRGTQPTWAAAYLDQGKPESLVSFSRMNRFRNMTPAVIRPDIIPTPGGMVITELDSVPGGIGMTACLAQGYADLEGLEGQPARIIGGRDGMVQGFASMLRSEQNDTPGCVAIVVSDEAQDYRQEMQWLADRLSEIGLESYCVHPREVRFSEEGLWLEVETKRRAIGLVYRFFELFDLKNIAKAELVMYAAKKARVIVTPPYKPVFEEKLAFAFLHHPVLQEFWQEELGEAVWARLSVLMPRTWILDPQPAPPTAVIPHLTVAGKPISDYRVLGTMSQKERQMVIKPSGFSELAWGSRGVVVGHDVSQAEWAEALDQALAAFPAGPHVLQEFHKGRVFECSYADEATGHITTMPGRVRLSPYYFVAHDKAELGGILATVCSVEKKVIHGMEDAIMVPCAEGTTSQS